MEEAHIEKELLVKQSQDFSQTIKRELNVLTQEHTATAEELNKAKSMITEYEITISKYEAQLQEY